MNADRSPTETPYLDYYGKHGIIPARQDISDQRRHFQRRRALFLQLGIPPVLVAGRSVIEFGPGPGDNAVFTASLGPGRYQFVDGNRASLDELTRKQKAGAFGTVPVAFAKSDMIAYQDQTRYALVWAEGVIQGQINPARYLRHVADFAVPGGIVVTTTTSHISIFPEMCRRLVKPVIASGPTSFEQKIETLVAFFRPDLQSLKGMSRLPSDWVMDTILHPWQAATFSIPEAIDAIGQQFDFLGSSPRFLVDWRWYKTIDNEDAGFNDLARAQYARYAASLMDYRSEPNLDVACDGLVLEQQCNKAFDLQCSMWEADDLSRLPEFLAIVDEVARIVAPAMPATASALRAYMVAMPRFAAGDLNADFGDFRTLFGRGQQYVSFVRKS